MSTLRPHLGHDASGTTLRIEGTLDVNSTPDLRPILDTVVARRTPVRLDLSALRLIDSFGVCAIVSLYKRIRADGGAVTVTGLSRQPLAIFRVLRLDRVFDLDEPPRQICP